MTLCAVCKRECKEHSETQAVIHLMKLSQEIEEHNCFETVHEL